MNGVFDERRIHAVQDTHANWALRAENAELRRFYLESQAAVTRHELALREGDHRIKNSLQIVSSLMSVQERREKHPVAKLALRTAGLRILAVARMHDALQLAGGGDEVDVGSLIQAMCVSLQAMAGDQEGARISVDATSLRVPIALAQPIVLTVNELVINALRHAFPDDRQGTVHVSLAEEDDVLRLQVFDNGVGLPDGYLHAAGFGMTLVRMMVAKINATLIIENDGGAHFTVRAPLAVS